MLPDHRHCVWALPEGDADFATRWRVIKARFARAIPPVARRESLRRRREHGVWQRRLREHPIRDEQDWDNHIQYCWFNPAWQIGYRASFYHDQASNPKDP
ncbi:REP-associated tyrosine transposase [Pararhodobacter aggregans]|uniref:REP-associated tyrosine transposase n=1 Tax=Pararhodobacter aggregans TaxID=404875 RepID=UPI003B50A0CD